MTPTPQSASIQEPEGESILRPLVGEEVVISGISGVFPRSKSTQEFMENLYNKVDMVTQHERWNFHHPEVPTHLGQVDEMDKFDAQFFRVHYKQATTMEPMSRKLLEHAYSAIYDSGMNPNLLRGKKVGVFIGSMFSESEKIVIYENIQRNGFGITGCNKAMYANRISYWIDGKGPSMTLDVACASSAACIEHAYRSIMTGQCDAAIVGGCNLCMHPCASLNMNRHGFLCMDGKTKVFDKNGDGYVRADAINVLFLQKAKDAKRIYAEVYHAKMGYSSEPPENWTPTRKSRDIENFLETFYKEINVSPSQVEYVEANGSATAEADGNELEALGRVFGKAAPIKVGSVKSIMGHSEPASGTSAATKLCLAYHKGTLPGNIHYNEPQNDIPSVKEGRVHVLLDTEQFNRSFSALNCFSYGGVNIHILLKGHYKQKDLEQYKSNIPHLILISGRTDQCVEYVLKELTEKPVDPEQISLIHNIHQYDIPGHMCRGYTVLGTNENNATVSLAKKTSYYDAINRPIWFVYSGMGSQWAGMGADLMRIPIFASAIQRCHKVLEPKGLDIIKILTDPDKTIYNNILNSFVGIAAVQIGLTDILHALGIVPDNIIGHSVGELGCAYADGCFTAEEMILAAYSRGLVSIQTPFIRGSMAAVGLGYNEVLGLCPPEIEVACHNSSTSSTISGPADIMKTFVADLTKKGIFAKEVASSNIAYHSRYIADAGPGLLKYLNEVITNPKLRSEKWVSTSVPKAKWNEECAKYSSAEYHTNNLLNPVLFEETSALIPENALLIEIAPHGLLQAILKRSHESCVNIPLTRRAHDNPSQFLLEAIGQLYQEGLNLKVDALYPQVQYPVSTETPFLSHLVQWEHSEDWPIAIYNTTIRVTSPIRHYVLSTYDDEFRYLKEYKRQGKIEFPEAAHLVLVWETYAMFRGYDYKKMSVTFENVQFHSNANVHTEESLYLDITIQKGTNLFEVCHLGNRIVSGSIQEMKKDRIVKLTEIKDTMQTISSKDVYKIMRSKGHSYSEDFQSIISTNNERNLAKVVWNNDWVKLIDSLIQLNIFERDSDGCFSPMIIKKIAIDVEQHIRENITDLNDNQLDIQIDEIICTTKCGGIVMSNLIFTESAPPIQKFLLETKTFIPHFLTGNIKIEQALLINLQIIAENITKPKIPIFEILYDNISLADIVNCAIDKVPEGNFSIHTVPADIILKDRKMLCQSDVFIVNDFLQDELKMKEIYVATAKGIFVLTFEDDKNIIKTKYKFFDIISIVNAPCKKIILLRKIEDIDFNDVKYINVTHDTAFSWVPRVRSEIQKSRTVVLVSENQYHCGLLGFVKKINENMKKSLVLVVVDDVNAPPFNPSDRFYKEQLQKNLTFNVFKQNMWGGLYYLPSSTKINYTNFRLSSTLRGIENLCWNEIPSVRTTDNTVQVCYAGPTLRDALKAVGDISNDEMVYGRDFSGYNNKDQKVMGIINGGAIASVVEADPNLIWPVPNHWSLEDAATVPLPYVYAYYCLAQRFKLIKCHKVFVNSGTGAVGQAVISVALAIGCTVYTTVGDMQKKRLLLKTFPQLKENNIGYSRSDMFYAGALVESPAGYDFVVSTLSGSSRQVAMKLVGFHGFFMDLSDTDKYQNNSFGMQFLDQEKYYVAFDINLLFRADNIEEKRNMQNMILNGIVTGIVRPLVRVNYSLEDTTKAFSILLASKHRSRVLLKLRDPLKLNHTLKIQPRMTYSPVKVQVLVCGDSIIGVELVERLVKKGAKKIVINLESSLIDHYFRMKLSSWRKQDVDVQTYSMNLQSELECSVILNEAVKLGGIEGIFITQDSKVQTDNLESIDFLDHFDKTAFVVGNLDYVSRNICPKLRFFVVVSHGSENAIAAYTTSVSHSICQKRNEVGLPALSFHVPLINLIDNIDLKSSRLEPQTLKNVFDSLETSLKLKHEDAITFVMNKQANNLLNKILNILDVKSIEDVPENTTLKQLGLNDSNIREVTTIHRKFTNIYHAALEELTIKNLKELSNETTRTMEGLQTFFTFIDKDELTATEPLLSMATKFSSSQKTEKEEELDPKADYLMLIPGFSGHHQIFNIVCERLKLQAMTLQLGPDLTNETIHETAVNILKFMKRRFELKSKFYLLGYSYGVNIALELASLIEKEGHVGIVYCLDSSPDALRVQLDVVIGNLSDSDLQNAIVEHMYHLMSGEDDYDLKDELKNAQNWSQKIDLCVSKLRGLVTFSSQYQRSILQAAYNRLNYAKSYEPDFKLESEIILMKGIPHPDATNLSEDYGLSKYSKHPIKVFNLDSEHALTPYDGRVSNIVNRFLEPRITEAFTKQNQCQVYIYHWQKIWF